MFFKSLNGLALNYLKTIFTRNCEGELAFPLPRSN